mmetsp:Transcript_10447/g.26531  ORF Transcript_10447/g.26531 Transcript_10447/m.26531 type:complete len:207 (-) Transcript_10447:1094-1714(-)
MDLPIPLTKFSERKTKMHELTFIALHCVSIVIVISIRLGTTFPDVLSLGLEIRDKVSEYVRERIDALRKNHEGEGTYQNIACFRANAMRDLPHYFRKHQLKKLFFLFPDPHFKASNHRRRIITTTLLDEYAYLLAPGGMIYTITDVAELGEWMRDHLERHPMFARVSDEELAEDPAAQHLPSASEEGQKVARNCGKTFRSVYRKTA